MTMSVREFAQLRGVSEQRARELARTGSVQATKSFGTWVIHVDENHPLEVARHRPLSRDSQSDLLTYLDTFSFDHVTGHRRSRLARRLKELDEASDSARLLRDYFRNAPIPEGTGAAALVRAAMLHKDKQVQERLVVRPRHVLNSPSAAANKLRNSRILAGLRLDEAAEAAGISSLEFRELENHGHSDGGNLALSRALSAVGSPTAKLMSRSELSASHCESKTAVDSPSSTGTRNISAIAAALANANLSAVNDAIISTSMPAIQSAIAAVTQPEILKALKPIKTTSSAAAAASTFASITSSNAMIAAALANANLSGNPTATTRRSASKRIVLSPPPPGSRAQEATDGER